MKDEAYKLTVIFLMQRIQEGIEDDDMPRVRLAFLYLRAHAPDEARELWDRLPEEIRVRIPRINGD